MVGQVMFGLGTFWQARCGKVRRGLVRQFAAGTAWCSRQAPAWRGAVRPGRYGLARRVKAAQARWGWSGSGVAKRGLAWQARFGSARRGSVWSGALGMAGKARYGTVGQVAVR